MDLQIIQNNIFEVRGCRVMLDYHLAELYQVETRALKQAVKRNIERFPSDFMFVLTQEEANLLLSIEGVQKVFGTLDLFVSLLETEIKYPILQGGILPFWTPS